MQYRQIGNSDLRVSEIALGSWLTYGGAINDNTSRECLASGFDCGINFIDTANAYAKGAAESFLGEELARPGSGGYSLVCIQWHQIMQQGSACQCTPSGSFSVTESNH